MRSDLVARLISAAVLIPIALYVVWAGGWWLAAGSAAFAWIMAYEWAGISDRKRLVFVTAFLGAAASPAWLVYGWLGAGAVLLLAVLSGVILSSRRLIAAGGALYTALPPVFLLVLREGEWDGRTAALIIMATVWASDAAAYFAGRGFGGPALSPKDSPNKTWSGALGAVMSTMLCGLIAAGLVGGDRVVWLVFGAGVSIVAQLGDFYESLIKRRFGVKDAGSILPGHGGLMDRVDGFGAVCVVSVLAFSLYPQLVELLRLS